MGERLGRAGRGPWVLFLSALQFIVEYLKRIPDSIGRLPNQIRLLLRRLTIWAIQAFWALIGRCGLALRNILTALLWRPLLWLTRPFIRAGRQIVQAIWAFIGRCGMALHNLLHRFIWQPLLLVSTPLRWFYRRFLRRPVNFAALSLHTFLEWLALDILAPVLRASPSAIRVAGRRTVDISAAQWKHLERVGGRMNEMAGSVELPVNLEPASRRPRLNRLTTAIVSTSIILIVGFLTTQGRQSSEPVALSQAMTRPAVAPLVPKMTNTPTVTPSPTPTATPTALPTAHPALAVEKPAAWPTPDPLGKGGSVAFTMRQNGNGDIYALSIGRSQPIRLTNHPADDRDPSWSPDGRSLAFASRRDGNWEIYVLHLETGELRRVTDDPAFNGGPSWSPDGQWLVYESYREGNLDLFIAPVDGSNPPIRLTENPALDFSPAWSPDGRHIAFSSFRSGNKDIFVLALDAAFDELAINVTGSPDRNEDHPAWEPQGRYLAYFDDGDGLELIYALPMEDYRPAGPAFSVGQGRHPSWSPDGSSLVYVHNSGEQSYIIASSVDAWSVAPQAYASQGYLDDLSWTSIILPPGLEEIFPLSESGDGPLFVERSEAPRKDGPAFLLREVKVDAPAPYLNDQVDDSFHALRDRVVAEVGWDFLAQVDNMFAFLTSRPSPGESDRSWSKAARAFDFYYRYPISIEPQVEVVREDRGAQTYWRIYLRAANQDGSQGEPLRQLPWDFSARYDSDPRYYDQGGKWKDHIPAGYYLDFTELASDYGWTRVPALDNWRTFFQGIRYWHFENRQGLSWQEAILELYTAEELEQAYNNR